jgi:GH25 family lysozyme M1 (1,4-beta-N-acetylmuramidase)
MAVKGIDVSHWNGSVDFNKVKQAGYSFVIINAGYGRYANQKDERFEENYKKANAAGLGVGAYWYSYALKDAEALEEAKLFAQVIKGKQFEYPVAFDIEDRSQSALNQAQCSSITKTFCEYMQKQGYYISIYSYTSFLKNKISKQLRTDYDVWVANFDVAKPDYSDPYGIWQYTSKGVVPGVNGNCDCNYSYKDYPAIMKAKGLTGFKKVTPTTKTLDTKGMKQGDKNLGVYELKSLLSLLEKCKYISTHITVDDGFGAGTTTVVNDLLKKWGYVQNGIAGENFVNKVRAVLSGKL